MSLYLFPIAPYDEISLKTPTAGPSAKTLFPFVEQYAPWREFSKSSAVVGGKLIETHVAFSDVARYWGLSFDFRSKVVSVRALGVAKKDSAIIGSASLDAREFENLLAFVKGQSKDFSTRVAESLASYSVASGNNGAISEDAAERLFHGQDLTTSDISRRDERFDIRHAHRYGRVLLGIPTVLSDNDPEILEKLEETKKRAAQYPFAQANTGPKKQRKSRSKKKKST